MKLIQSFFKIVREKINFFSFLCSNFAVSHIQLKANWYKQGPLRPYEKEEG